jgi:hypothetical protein
MINLWDTGEEGDEAHIKFEVGSNERCTPERLLAFIQLSKKTVGRMPNLAECKAKFGGILGPMVDYWELKRKGLA